MKIPFHLHCINLKRFLAGSLLLLVFLAGCKRYTEQESVLLKLFENEPSGKRIMLFVPLDGCGTCIQNSATFINERLVGKENLNVYVYSLYKKKYLQFSKEVNENNRFIIDPEGKTLTALHVEQKPRVIFVEDGEITGDLFYDNGNDKDIFERILNY